MARQHRSYTNVERMEAVAAATVHGAKPIAAKTGIPRRTISYWLTSPEFAELRQRTKAEMHDGFAILVSAAQERLAYLIPTMDARDLITLMGVATDKKLLLSGDATSRSEHRSLSDELDDHERAALRDVLAGELERRQTADGDSLAGLDPAATPGPTD